MTTLKKKKTSKTHSTKKATKYNRGALGAGTAYVILGILLIGAAGSMMIGNISPSTKDPTNGQTVVISTKAPEPGKNNLQLYYFPGATYTPTPSPTIPPEPNEQKPRGSSGGSGGGSTCFVAGTKILMADNSQKNIEAVRVGDQVMGYDEKNKKLVKEIVLELDAPIRDHHINVTLEDGTVIGLTDEHPLYTKDGWKAIEPQNTAKENPTLKVGKLKTGDQVLKESGKYVVIVSMQRNNGAIQTYNLKTVTGFNNFFADGVLAHNKGGGGGGQTSGSGL